MKLISILSAVLMMGGCINHSSHFEDCLDSEKGIILSCVRCGCMEDLLKEYVRKYGFSLLPVYTDSNCLERQSILKRSTQLSQSKLDSLYKENYNIILFRKNSGTIQYRVINTDEVLLFNKIREEFFSSTLRTR